MQFLLRRLSKLVDEISLNFRELFVIGKYLKIWFKNLGSSCYFLIIFYGVSHVLMQKLIYTINIWLNFVPGPFFEQDHPLKLIILKVYAKRWPICACVSKQKLVWSKIWSMIGHVHKYQTHIWQNVANLIIVTFYHFLIEKFYTI